jgi:hypothetical protein
MVVKYRPAMKYDLNKALKYNFFFNNCLMFHAEKYYLQDIAKNLLKKSASNET